MIHTPESRQRQKPARAPRVCIELDESDAEDLLNGKVTMFTRAYVAGALGRFRD